MNKKFIAAVFGFILLGLFSTRLWANSIEVSPQTFDFGWAPDNAILFCEFTAHNITGALVPLNAVQPSCGCTATNFTPEGLPPAEIKKIQITFNTRGYSGINFHKLVTIKAGSPEESIPVTITGTVTDSKAQIVPDGDGVVSFEKGSDSEAKVSIVNKSSSTVVFSVIQPPAEWVQLKVPSGKIDAGHALEVKVKASGSFEQSQQTSFTLEASAENLKTRLTIAIRTGEIPAPYRRIRTAPKAEATPNAVGSPAQPKK